MEFARVLGVLCSLLAACGGKGPARAAEAHETGIRLGSEPGPALSYSWRGKGVVPCVPGGPDVVPFGEFGRDPDTALYLGFNASDPLAEVPLLGPGEALEGRELASGEGRFGRGCVLGERSLLRFTFPAAPERERVWSVELWIRPEALKRADLFSLGELLQVRSDASGRVVLEIPGALEGEENAPPATLTILSKGQLTAGGWNHVGVVLDLAGVQGARVVVNGEVQGRRVDPERVLGEPGELVLGDLDGRGGGLSMSIDELRLERRNLSTAELEEHWSSQARALERLEVVRAGGVTEELESWSTPITAARVEGAEAFARGELVHAVADEAGLRWTVESWEEVEAYPRPLARTTHPSLSIGQGRVLVYGGETRDTHFGRMVNTADTWIFDASARSWTRVHSALAPQPRCHMPAAYSPDHDVVLIQGGWWNEEKPQKYYADTWIFHPASGEWERVPYKLRQPHPPSSTDHGLVYLPRRKCFLLLREPNAWLFDPVQRTWSAMGEPRRVDERGAPAAYEVYGSPICAVDPRTDQVLVFGGQKIEDSGSTFTDATALFDVESNTLTLLDTPVRPPARVRGALGFDPVRERFVMFGGVLDENSERFDDLWVFDPRARAWREIPAGQGRPGPRGGYYGLAYDEVGDRFVLAQGRNSHLRFLDDTLFLDLAEERAGHARYLFDRAALPRDLVWFAECETPAGTSVGLRFRASSDGHRFGAWVQECPPGERFVEVEVELVPDGRGNGPSVRAMGFRDAS